ncbi:PTS lactose/cellobiose transporter subunit IIA [Loigolactobacillus jiayinensis]|uniref:PTS lactose/cellobiose transporter subunit IIA n=1 Tax=Loigolactobacillus jiayinensis TaxID=2486016 RepID=A0ABW1RBF8_9LACO|nr:PTS lactose/cellobiose transporter subunit IIA [Loigolactobacillus jiayinensis]
MQVVMQIILAGGNAKNFAMQAITAAKNGDFTLAQQQMDNADKSLVEAHNVQTNMLTKEAQGQHTPVDLYMVHAQDHLMTAITFKDLANEVVAVYQRLATES